jgi:hypothetical protein
MVGIAAGTDVKIDVISYRSRCDNRILLVFGSHLRERVVGLRIDDRAFFNPPDLVFFGLYTEKSSAMFQHFQLLAIRNLAYMVRYGSYPIFEVYLPGRDVDSLMRLVT